MATTPQTRSTSWAATTSLLALAALAAIVALSAGPQHRSQHLAELAPAALTAPVDV